MDEQGHEVGRFRLKRATDPSAFVSAMVELIRDWWMTGSAFGYWHRPAGERFAAAGAIRNANIQVINGYRLQDELEQRLGQPVVLANDGNCFALSEACDGAGAVSLVLDDAGDRMRRRYCAESPAPARRDCRGVRAYHVAGISGRTMGLTRCYCGNITASSPLFPATGLSERYRLLTGDSLSE
jgi:fructokinase